MVSDYDAGLKIIEINDPSNPLIVSSIDTNGFTYKIITIEIREKIYVLVADSGAGLKIIEVTDP